MLRSVFSADRKTNDAPFHNSLELQPHIRLACGPRPERTLHDRRIRPVAEFESDRRQITHLPEPEGFVQLNRGTIGSIDIANHLPISRRSTSVDELGQKQPADARMQMVRVDIDRMFDDVTIGRPLAKGHRISVANHSPVQFGDKMRQPMLLHVLTPPPEVREFRCVESIASRRIDANPDMMKAYRRAKNLEPLYRFCFPTAVDFNPATDEIIVADSQRNRLQVYRKVRDYQDFQANL